MVFDRAIKIICKRCGENKLNYLNGYCEDCHNLPTMHKNDNKRYCLMCYQLGQNVDKNTMLCAKCYEVAKKNRKLYRYNKQKNWVKIDWIQNPKKQKAYAKKYYDKIRADPVKWKAYREYRREYYKNNSEKYKKYRKTQKEKEWSWLNSK